MEGLLDSTTPMEQDASGQPERKRRTREATLLDGLAQSRGSREGSSGDLQDIKKIIDVLCKLGLSNALSARVLEAVVLQAMLTQVSNKYVVAIKASNASYLNAGKGLSKEQKEAKHAVPHGHAWNAMLTVLKGESPDDAAAVQAYVEQLTLLHTKEKFIHGILENVKVVRLQKAYGQDNIKLKVGVNPGTTEHELWKRIKNHLVRTGSRPLMGTAPPGQLEQAIQEYLEKSKE